MRAIPILLLLCTTVLAAPARAADLPQTVAAVKPSIVGVGTYQPLRSPPIVFFGTGWATGDGLSIITNAHVLPPPAEADVRETLGIVLPTKDNGVQFRPATLAGLDKEHDLAHLRLSGGAPLPPMALGDGDAVQEGQVLALTGFPLGMTLGLHHATHHALLAAITPIVLPSLNARQLDARAVAALQRRPFNIYQLDGTVYPGNSGSPVYDPASGKVLAVINMTLVKELKESAITNPSGISYAIPVRYVRELLQHQSP